MQVLAHIFSHSCALRRIAEALETAHTSGEVSFEEARALRWLKEAKNASPAAPVVAPALPPVEKVAAAAQPASPAAVVPPPPEQVVAAAHEPVAVAVEVTAPEQAATAEVPQVASSRALWLGHSACIDSEQAQAEQRVQQPSLNIGSEKPRFPRALNLCQLLAPYARA